MRKDLFKEQIF